MHIHGAEFATCLLKSRARRLIGGARVHLTKQMAQFSRPETLGLHQWGSTSPITEALWVEWVYKYAYVFMQTTR